MASGATSPSRKRPRRGLLGKVTGLCRRWLRSVGATDQEWLDVCAVSRLAPGESVTYRTPAGITINVARRGERPEVESFLAVSASCPHIVCPFHGEARDLSSFCPCHGERVEPGSSAWPGQPLLRYPLKIANGRLYLAVPRALPR